MSITRYCLAFAALILFQFGSTAQEVFDDFDDRRQLDYGFIHGEFFEYRENPDASGSNTSANVAQYFRNPVEVFDVIVADPGQMADISDYISGTKTMKLDVYAPAAGITVQITLEDSTVAGPTNYPTGRRAEFTATTSVAEDWETLEFSLANEPDPGVANTATNRLVLLFNPGTAVSQTWYFDNLQGPERVTIPCDPASDEPLIFWDGECEHDIPFGFIHGVLKRRPNPETAGANTSDYALRYDRNVGEMDDVILGDFPAPLSIGADTKIEFDVYDVNAPSVYILSIQTSTGADLIAIGDSTDASEVNTWTTMSYDISGLAAETDAAKFVLLYKPGNFLNGRTFIDNWRLENPPLSANEINFEELEVYPNPSTSFLNIDLPYAGQHILQIWSIDGGLMMEQELNQMGNHIINTADLSNGQYIARIVSAERVLQSDFVVAR